MVLRREALLKASYPAFKKALEERGCGYNSLSTLRSFLMNQEKISNVTARKIRFVQNLMSACLEEGNTTRRRRPGTGQRVVVQVEYRDTPDNRRKGRVGKTYERVEYKDAEWIDHKQTTMRKMKVKSTEPEIEGFTAPVRRNLWIEAVAEANEVVMAGLENPPKFVPVRKEVKDPSDEKQVLGHKLYLKACEIMERLRAEHAQAKGKQAPEFEALKTEFDPKVVDAFLQANSTRAYRKLVRRHGIAVYECLQAIKRGEDWRPVATRVKAAEAEAAIARKHREEQAALEAQQASETPEEEETKTEAKPAKTRKRTTKRKRAEKTEKPEEAEGSAEEAEPKAKKAHRRPKAVRRTRKAQEVEAA